MRENAVRVNSRLELFVDYHIIDELKDVQLRLCTPREEKLGSGAPSGDYMTMLKDGNNYKAYYRSYAREYQGKIFDGNPGEITCYAESLDGHAWTQPKLGLHKIDGTNKNNVILANASPYSHNFCPFLDTRPDVKPDQRFKAIAGTHAGGGIFAFVSPDGIHWKMLHNQPIITSKAFAFDSQNVAFWSQSEDCYVCYFRSWQSPHGQLRTISRATSPDFLHWQGMKSLSPNEKNEHLYTNNTHPYFRAPLIYIALPTRFFPERGNCTDIVLMTSRGGTRYIREFMEAFIRPGIGVRRWHDRANYAALNVVPTSETEMSIYHGRGHRRYILRIDGFTSLNAGYKGGTMVTKPMIFKGSVLALNFSTSGGGHIRVEIETEKGEALADYSLADCQKIVGDRIEHVVSWNGISDLSQFSEQIIRLKFVMADADLYSLQFR